MRANGSAIETLFGQLKFSAGGHLSADNYGSTLGSFSAKQAVGYSRNLDKTYKCEQLNIESTELIRKRSDVYCTKST